MQRMEDPVEEGRLLEAAEACPKRLSGTAHLVGQGHPLPSAKACVCPDACDLGLREQVYSLRFSHAL